MASLKNWWASNGLAFSSKDIPICGVKQGTTNLSLARAMGSTSNIIENWFDQYEDLIAQLGIDDPAYI